MYRIIEAPIGSFTLIMHLIGSKHRNQLTIFLLKNNERVLLLPTNGWFRQKIILLQDHTLTMYDDLKFKFDWNLVR